MTATEPHAEPAPPPLPIGMFAAWLVDGRPGLSSMTIVRRVTGQPCSAWLHSPDDTFIPIDFDDLDRCMTLVAWVPQVRGRIPLMRDVSPGWRYIADRWDELESLWHKAKRGDATSIAPIRKRLREAGRLPRTFTTEQENHQ